MTPEGMESFVIVMPSGCWEWQGRRSERGYGRVWHDQRLMMAHRVYWEMKQGLIPDGLWVLHHCDNPPCIRLDHLYIGDRLDNARDMVERRRAATGARNSQSRLTDEQVKQIREESVTEQIPSKVLAAKYGIADHTIRAIATGEYRRYVDGPTRPKGDGRGEANPASKLTLEQVQRIRERYAQGGTSHMKLAREYGVSHSTIGRIVQYQRWPQRNAAIRAALRETATP